MNEETLRAEWDGERGKRLRAKAAARVEKDTRSKRAAAVRAEKLTGTAEWDWLVVELEAMRASFVVDRDRALEAIRNPRALLSIDDLVGVRQQLLVREAELALLEKVISMPEKVISEGTKQSA